MAPDGVARLGGIHPNAKDVRPQARIPLEGSFWTPSQSGSLSNETCR
jgi:hypothetical protein